MATDLEIIIKAKDEASKDIDKVSGSVDKLDKKAKETTTSTGGLWKQFAVGTIAANLLQTAGGEVIRFLKDSITEALEAEKIQNKLASALRSSGQSAIVMGGILDEFASNMQSMTGITDEEVKSLVTLALNLGVNKNLLQEVTKGAIGLATALNIDTETALKAVSNAYNGQWQQVTKLLPELKDMTSSSEKMAYLQQKMAEGLDQATAAMKGQAGQLISAKNQWNDFKEATGKALLTLFSGLKSVSDSFTGYSALQKAFIQNQREYNYAMEEAAKKHKTYTQILIEEKTPSKEIAETLEWMNKNIDENGKLIKKTTTETSKYNEKLEEAKKYTEKYGSATRGLTDEGQRLYFQLAQLVGLLPKFTAETQKAAEEEEDFNKRMAELVTTSGELTAVGEGVMIAMYQWAGLLPTITEETGKASDKTEKFKINWKDTSDVLEASRQVMETVKKALSDIGIELGPQAEAFMDAADGAMTFVDGLTKGNPLTMIAGGFKLIGSLIKAFAGDGVGEAIKRENQWMNLTKQQIAQLKELEKQYGSTHAATSEMLDQIIQNADITNRNFDVWTNRVREILSDLDQGKMTIGQTRKEIGDAFTALIAKAKELGTEGSAGLMTFFDDLKNRGLKVGEVQEYINEQLQKGLEGYKAMKEAMIENGEATEAFGNINIEVYEQMLAYEKKVEENKGLVNAIKGAEQALISLSNAQRLTEEQFDSFALSASTAYDKLIEGGMNSGQALQTLAPYLQRLQFLHEEYGYTIDENTQKIIDQAIAEGKVVENKKTETRQIIDLLSSIAKALGADIPDAMKKTGQAAEDAFNKAKQGAREFGEELDKASRDRTVHILTQHSSEGASQEQAATGFEGWVGKPTRFLVGEAGPEYVSVTPRNKIGKGGKSAGGINVEQNIIINGVNLDKESIVEAIRIAIPNNIQGLKTTIQQAVAEVY